MCCRCSFRLYTSQYRDRVVVLEAVMVAVVRVVIVVVVVVVLGSGSCKCGCSCSLHRIGRESVGVCVLCNFYSL